MTESEDTAREKLLQELALARARIAKLEAVVNERGMAAPGESLADSPANSLREQALQKGGAKFRDIIDVSPVPYALNDEQQNITYLNPAFIDTFGYDLDDIPTLSEWWPRAYPDPDYRTWVATTWQQRLNEARQEKRPFRALELEIRCKNGTHRSAMVGAASLTGQFEGEHLVILYDITKRKRAETELNEALLLLENVINSTPDMIFVKNAELQTVLCNDAYASAVGKSREAMYGKTDIENGWDADLVHGNPDKGIRGFIQDDLDALAGRDVHNPYDPANVNGEIRIFDTHKLPLRDSEGGVIGVVGMARDITERTHAEQELQRHRASLELMVAERTEALEDANRELESFAYSVSHDLRAPLRAIDGFSQVLLDDYAGQLDEAAQDSLHRIRNGAQRMGMLIDDLLSLSRVNSCEIRREDIDLSGRARAAMRKLQEFDPQRRVDIHIAADVSGRGDACLMDVVMDNLLGNAWKYTGKTDAARIEFGCREEDGRMIYYVRDNGIGFDMKYAGQLFSPFQRLHKAGEFEGTGIGLATVARIIHRHGGQVWAEATVNQGTTIYFTLGAHRRG